MAAWTEPKLKKLIHETIDENSKISSMQEVLTNMAINAEQAKSNMDKVLEIVLGSAKVLEELRPLKQASQDHSGDILMIKSALKHHLTNKKIHLPE